MPQFELQVRNVDGSVVNIWQPLDLNFTKNLNDEGSIACGFGRGDETLTQNVFGPYRNDWFLYRDTSLLGSGPITEASWSSNSEGIVMMAGRTWEHLLERRLWFFDPEQRYDNPMLSDYIYRSGIASPADAVAIPRNLHLIMQDLLDNVTLHGTGTHDPAWFIEGDTIPTQMAYTIYPFDTTTILQHIKTIAEQDNGFDFEVQWSGVYNLLYLYLYYQTKDTGTIQFSFTRDNILSIDPFTNKGPLGTRNYVIGEGIPANNWGYISEYQESLNRFRTLENVVRFGKVTDLNALQRLATSEGVRTKEPQLELKVTVDPDAFPNFWDKIDTGIRIHMDYDFGFHDLDSTWRVLGYDLTVNRQGDPIVAFDIVKFYE